MNGRENLMVGANLVFALFAAEGLKRLNPWCQPLAPSPCLYALGCVKYLQKERVFLPSLDS